MSVYWSILHAEQMKEHEKDKGEVWHYFLIGHGRVFHLKIVHSVPGFVCFINSFQTYSKLKPAFWKLISGMVGVYGTFIWVIWIDT